MRVHLVRHATCDANHTRRFLGRATDAPLSKEGRARCREVAVAGVERVFSSPMARATETCRLAFPGAEVVSVAGLEEFDFGAFEGHTNEELTGDARYQAWIDGWCQGPCPGGEDRASFDARTRTALEALLRREECAGTSRVIVVCHGGTIMAAMSAWTAAPAEDDGYFSWGVANLGGYALTADLTGARPRLLDVRRFDDVREVLP